MNPQRSALFAFAFLAGVAAGPVHAHCNGGPTVTCNYDPCHHPDLPECKGLRQGAQVARNIASPEVKTEIGNVLIIPKLKLPVSPTGDLPLAPKLSAPVGQLPASAIPSPTPSRPAPAALPIRSQDDVDGFKVQVLSAIRDGENTKAITELIRKNPKLGADAVNRMVGFRLGRTYELLEKYHGIAKDAEQRSHNAGLSPDTLTDLERTRRLLDTLILTPERPQ